MHQFLCKARLRAFPGCRITIFRELKLNGTYPDIVLVAWRPSVTCTWNPERKNINAHDLRLLQHLVARGLQPESDLLRLFGTGYAERVERLAACRSNPTDTRQLESETPLYDLRNRGDSSN